jgi:hypothetical protein
MNGCENEYHPKAYRSVHKEEQIHQRCHFGGHCS